MAQPRPTMPTMFEEFSFMGYWWRPEDPDTKWPGEVTYKPESDIELEIMDEWEHRVSYPHFPLRLEILHGKSPHFPLDITLLRNQWLSEDPGLFSRMSGTVSGRYRSEYLIAGHHFSSPEDVTLKSVNVSFSNFRGWMWSDSPFSLKEEGDTRTMAFNPCPKHIPVELNIPAKSSPIRCNLILREIIEEQQGPSILTPSEIQHKRACYVHLEPSKPQSLAWFREQIDGIRDLLAFLTGMRVETKSITARYANAGQTESEIDIYHFVRPTSTDADRNVNMCFPFRMLGEERARNIFETWFDKRDTLWSPVRLCLDVNYNPRQSNDDKLVALVRALESCRLIMKVSDRGVLKNLKCLRNRLPQPLQDELRLTDTLLCSVRNTRHFLIHPDSEKYPHETRLHDLELAEAIVRLVPFAVSLLYKEIGFCDDSIRYVFNKDIPRGWWLFPNNSQAQPTDD